jgi:hypothetical protein
VAFEQAESGVVHLDCHLVQQRPDVGVHQPINIERQVFALIRESWPGQGKR